MRAAVIPVNADGRRIGQTHHRAKLSDGAVDQILALSGTGMSYSKIAARFGVAKSTVRDIVRGRIRTQLCAHRFKQVAWTPAVQPALALQLPDPTADDDWRPEPGPSVESLALPPINDEEPGQRAMRLIAWTVTKEPHEQNLDTQAG